MDPPRITIRWSTGPTDLSGALAVRRRVFCGEQGVPEDDEPDADDERALHLVAVGHTDGAVVGTLRLLYLGEDAKIGRVAVERAWRRRGIAARMLALAIARAREHGSRRARLAAQLQATALYEQAGFAVESDRFEEAGIPHVWMGMTLSA